ncbi:MAG: hypothetical protein A2174_01100 [Candidatus Portnoybacteria bacterium RBG_13_41_18]|uniref:Calcineurin-like phosphoesterase domain-containing protein n=1 Tax=Candidatus Portnoybacteria bacterium RBG_13_41_18 TaxID=1801991 RepID=A0A1G2F4W8_9BACT|nr:MAG: hypothetical protein A2174_01100 [Candidatus Portnoybacteria bacterium RBG_13_41_18]
MNRLFLIFFVILAFTILIAAHWFLFKTVTRFFGLQNPNLILKLKIVFGILSVIFVLASLTIMFLNNFLSRGLYIFASSWLGFAYFFLLASFLIWIIFGITKIFSIQLNFPYIAGLIFGLAFLAGVYGIVNANNLRVKIIDVTLPNLPIYWQDKTAVWISDMHLGQVWNFQTAQRLAQKIQALNPDIVFIGGDLYDGVKADLDKLAKPFAKINAVKGIYFITGNHEEFGDKTPYIEAVKNTGIKVLNNELVNVDGLQIIGVDDRDSNNRDTFQKILDGLNINKQQPSILLKHTPFYIDVAQNAGVSLQLSGHTHEGQLFLFKYITQAVYKGFDFGLKKAGSPRLRVGEAGNLIVYTSSGALTWGPPMRVDTQPEIVVVKFE